MNKLEIMSIGGVDCYEKDGVAYLRLENVAYGLGIVKQDIKNGTKYVRIHKPNLQKWLFKFGLTKSENDELPEFIPENVFYRLAMKAKNDVAEAFQAKVADEIIPSLRKHGAYIVGQESMTREQLIAQALVAANDIIAERDKQINQLNETVAIMEPKASYYDKVLACKDLVPITIIAKDYGMSAVEMNKWLHDNGYQYKRNKTWVLYDKYADKGYTNSKTYTYEDTYGRTCSQMQTQWTQAGRLFLYQELKKNGILPKIEQETIQERM